MNTALHPSFVERFREADTPNLPPTKVGDIFGFSLLELAERARVHSGIPTARPDVSQLQNYLRDVIRFLAVATELSGDDRRAAPAQRAFTHLRLQDG
ncbi:hypothetical protein [Niveibacterium sp. SC-1]|uniref:hypothetical protein n=1 Tax=Niveibacterium sp. SC-1 TaxID=3135646 RepID=UPI00311FC2BA